MPPLRAQFRLVSPKNSHEVIKAWPLIFCPRFSDHFLPPFLLSAIFLNTQNTKKPHQNDPNKISPQKQLQQCRSRPQKPPRSSFSNSMRPDTRQDLLQSPQNLHLQVFRLRRQQRGLEAFSEQLLLFWPKNVNFPLPKTRHRKLCKKNVHVSGFWPLKHAIFYFNTK